MLAVFALCLVTVSLLFKELKLAAFDPEMATAVGINAVLMHYLLMGLVSITTVGAFEPVGAILVVAMLVVPPCTAYLLCDDLKKMLVISVVCGVLSSIGGYLVAQQLDASTAGAMTVVAGLLFVLAFLFSPSHGLVTRLLSQRNLSRSVVREDALQALWRLQQEAPPSNGQSNGASAVKPVDAIGLAALTRTEIGVARRTLDALRRTQMVQKHPAQSGFVLTASGEQAAQELVRRHRAYESYLESLGYPEDHVHAARHAVSEQTLPLTAPTGRSPLTPPGRGRNPAQPVDSNTASRMLHALLNAPVLGPYTRCRDLSDVVVSAGPPIAGPGGADRRARGPNRPSSMRLRSFHRRHFTRSPIVVAGLRATWPGARRSSAHTHAATRDAPPMMPKPSLLMKRASGGTAGASLLG
jgi:hypothetical protein